MAIVWDIFETDDRDETPENEKEWQCEECNGVEDLGLRDYRDEFGRECQEWICGACHRRLMGGRICL